MFPSLPADMYQFAGLFGQLVTVFPSQGLIVARFGNDNGSFAGGTPWEEEFYDRVLASITDEPVDMPKPKPDASDVSREDVDRGFFEAAQHPDEAGGGEFPATLPPKGPPRARATLIDLGSTDARAPTGTFKVTLHCPPRVAVGPAPGLQGPRPAHRAPTPSTYHVRPGKSATLRFQLAARLPAPARAQAPSRLAVRTRDSDRAQGAAAVRTFVLRAH